MLTRNASAPASTSRRIISGVLLAGPSVARIRTLRVRGTKRLGTVSLVAMGGGIATLRVSSTFAFAGRLEEGRAGFYGWAFTDSQKRRGGCGLQGPPPRGLGLKGLRNM